MDPVVSPVPSYITTGLRLVGGVVGGWLIGKGYFSAEQAAEVGGASMVLLTTLWAFYSSHSKTKKLNDAISAPAGYAK